MTDNLYAVPKTSAKGWALRTAVAGAVMVWAMMVGNTSAASTRAYSANANGNKLQCFSGTADNRTIYTGDCYFDGSTAIIKTDNLGAEGSYAGVYLQNSNLSGKLLSDVNKLAFSYDGTGAAGGSPRLSIPIDNNNDGARDLWAYIDTQGCNDGNTNTGTLNAMTDTTCTVSYNGQSYDNWGAFVAANPTLRIAKNDVTFVIVDQPGTFKITNVQLGKGPAQPAKNQAQTQTQSQY